MKQDQKNFFISYLLSAQVWVIPKLTPANLGKPINDIINYSTFICSFESGKCGKEEEKLQKPEYLENEKELFRWNKKHFWVFEGLSFGEKNKNLIKNRRHKL